MNLQEFGKILFGPFSLILRSWEKSARTTNDMLIHCYSIFITISGYGLVGYGLLHLLRDFWSWAVG